MLKRVCLFCGRLAVQPNREHVIPLWVLGLADSAIRMTTFGNPFGRLVEIPFKDYHFAACAACNSRYGDDLESPAKPVLVKLIAGEAVSSQELDLFIDWFDKIRVASWRGHLVMSDNPYEVEPQDAVDDAVGRDDTVLWIARSSTETKRVSILQLDPIFSLFPTCFGLICNNLMVLAYSHTQAGLWFLPEWDSAFSTLPIDVAEWANDSAVARNCEQWPLWDDNFSLVFRPGNRNYIPPRPPTIEPADLEDLANTSIPLSARMKKPHIFVNRGRSFACIPHDTRVLPKSFVCSDSRSFECLAIRMLARIQVQAMEDLLRVGDHDSALVDPMRNTAHYVVSALEGLSDEDLYNAAPLNIPTPPGLDSSHPAFIHKTQPPMPPP